MAFAQIAWEEKQATIAELKHIQEQFAARGWLPGASGSLSARVGAYTPDTYYFAMTSSCKDKSVHTSENFLFVDASGEPCETTSLMPSADTSIHAKIYRMTGCGAIFHVHTVFSSLISEYYGDHGFIPTQSNELLKELGLWEKNAKIAIPILPNYADIPSIAKLVPEAIHPDIPGIVLRNHGVYAWGSNPPEAKRRLEAFEFIFELEYRWLALLR
ncbi:methylthioribulose 1-phosphate dehydratase [Paenibacillus aceti]|uniref:Methylthioribulose-1-phosphate dehydratase n=1 Tax=Paenibacillus aceti TaxID=1820010 RepID=A0ABQ1W3I2_9BACL|nr:methylthioribulose 1-phosphate dehydratase [Paenibacillus aceti]GGG11916.1 methylthioribulose-1-phosphate dehydratase [Paenibacillus aceti]